VEITGYENVQTMSFKMKKVFVNRKPVFGPWGGGNNFVKSLFEFGEEFGIQFTSNPREKFEAILMIDPRYNEIGISVNEIANYKKENPSCPVFYRVNECDARKGTKEMDSLIMSMNSFLDEYIFVSEWVQNYFCKGENLQKIFINPKKSSVIYNGVDKNHFFENKDKPKSKKLRIVTHHWSNNKLKGFDIYDKIDEISLSENIQFTYVGRDRGTFKNSIVIPPLTGKDLGDAIRNHDLYISASRWDPGPNHVIEAVASGLPILAHKDGGGALEFAGYENKFENFDDLIEKIKYRLYSKSGNEFDNWKVCIKKYCETIRGHFEH
jgi:glycosyltransferase involved in cell wall biosynthesis